MLHGQRKECLGDLWVIRLPQTHTVTISPWSFPLLLRHKHSIRGTSFSGAMPPP